MEGIVKHGSEKRDLQPITCGKEKTFRTVWKEAELQDVFPEEQVEVEEMRRKQAKKARETRQEEGDGRDKHEEEEVRTEAEEKNMWNRKADGIEIDRGKKILYLLEFKHKRSESGF